MKTLNLLTFAGLSPAPADPVSESVVHQARPLISVIIIFFNAEKFLLEAIHSVFAQTYDHWELFLVDDGSTDGSSQIALHAAGQNPDCIQYLHHERRQNRGMSASRNLGIRYAQGEFIAFLDADDAWYPNALEEQVDILSAHPQAALVYGPIQYWYSWTGDPLDAGRDYIEELGVPPNTLVHPPRLLRKYLEDRAAVPSGFLVRREAIERYGTFEESFKGEYEDQVFCTKICLQAPVYASSRCWYRYRQHSDSCTAKGLSSGTNLNSRLVFLDWLKNYLNQQDHQDRGVWRALRNELLLFSHPRLFYFWRHNRHRWKRVTEWLERVNT